MQALEKVFTPSVCNTQSQTLVVFENSELPIRQLNALPQAHFLAIIYGVPTFWPSHGNPSRAYTGTGLYSIRV